MAARHGVDASSAVDPAALAAAGYTFIWRYLAPPGDQWKMLGQAELASYRRHGIGVGLFYEGPNGAAANWFTAANGERDAVWAQAAAAGLGLDDAPVFFAVDFDAADAHRAGVLAYFGAVRARLNARCCGYGGARVMGWLFDSGLITMGCQTRAWIHDLGWHPKAVLRQYPDRPDGLMRVMIGGVQCDLLDAEAGSFGLATEDDLTPDEHAMLVDVHAQITGGVGAGQTTYAGTVKATLATVQALVNRLNTADGHLAQVITDKAAAIVDVIHALPTGGLSAEEQQQLAGEIITAMGEHGIRVDPAPLLDALAARVAA